MPLLDKNVLMKTSVKDIGIRSVHSYLIIFVSTLWENNSHLLYPIEERNPGERTMLSFFFFSFFIDFFFNPYTYCIYSKPQKIDANSKVNAEGMGTFASLTFPMVVLFCFVFQFSQRSLKA